MMTELYTTNSHSKYTYKLFEPETQMFVFEIILKKFNEQTKTIHKIKKTKKGNLISSNDNILFTDVKEIKLTIIDINNPINEAIININLDHLKKYSTFINSDIYLEFFINSEYLESNYNFLHF
jgi:hypothetical protein